LLETSDPPQIQADAAAATQISPAETTDAVEAERRMVRHMIVSTLIAIPLLVAFWMGLVAIAISFTDIGYGPPLAMAAGVGALAGIFWGTWMGFVSYSNSMEAERHADRLRPR
jgi:uncharacterized membrane protein